MSDLANQAREDWEATRHPDRSDEARLHARLAALTAELAEERRRRAEAERERDLMWPVVRSAILCRRHIPVPLVWWPALSWLVAEVEKFEAAGLPAEPAGDAGGAKGEGVTR